MPHVLEGFRILDASTVLAGPGVTSLMADFGAEVIKLEQPTHGDPVRGYLPRVDEHSMTHKVTNRNKLCATLDLRGSAGQDVFKRLVACSDAVVMNYRLPTVRKWGLDYEQLRAVKQDIVMLHLTGYGRTGPYAARPGFARAIEAYTGLTYMTGFPDRGPIPSGYAVADALGAAFGAFSLALALLHKQRTGRGQLVDLALSEVMMRTMDYLYVSYDQTGEVPERVGTINPHIAPHDIYPTADGSWVSLPVSTQNMFVRLCNVLGVPELLEDPRFATNLERVKHRAELDEVIRPKVAAMSSDHLAEQLHAAGVAAAKINSVADVVKDEHVLERESLTHVFDEALGRSLLMQNVAPRLSDAPGQLRWPGRPLGADNDYVYRELLQIPSGELGELQRLGVI